MSKSQSRNKRKGEFFVNELTNEMLFYGGTVVAATSLVMALLYFCFTQIKKLRLDARLNTEYGERTYKK